LQPKEGARCDTTGRGPAGHYRGGYHLTGARLRQPTPAANSDPPNPGAGSGGVRFCVHQESACRRERCPLRRLHRHRAPHRRGRQEPGRNEPHQHRFLYVHPSAISSSAHSRCFVPMHTIWLIGVGSMVI
uniref:Uncharacterized protein n=1 Tax=Triticum urartu TaxID=4572 RepID=A0A8R7Q7C0_TRIUA